MPKVHVSLSLKLSAGFHHYFMPYSKNLSKRENLEYKKVQKMGAKKDFLGLQRWLKKFSESGAFWLSEKKQKYDKNNWL